MDSNPKGRDAFKRRGLRSEATKPESVAEGGAANPQLSATIIRQVRKACLLLFYPQERTGDSNP